MRYADPESVYLLTEIDPDTADPQELIALDNLELAVAAVIDAKCNRTFDGGVVPSTRALGYNPGLVYYADRVYIPESGLWFFGDFYAGDYSNPYISSTGLRNVTQVMAGGTWSGLAWTGEAALAIDTWQLSFKRKDGWYQGITIPSYRYADIRVTADWEDGAEGATVPADIREAATFILVDEWRIRHMSPAGEIGPAGLAIYLRNAWEYEMVKSAIANHAFRQMVV